jgi:hypothetical protein
MQEEAELLLRFRASFIINRCLQRRLFCDGSALLIVRNGTVFRATKFFLCGVVFRRKVKTEAAAAAIAAREREGDRAAGLLQRVWR